MALDIFVKSTTPKSPLYNRNYKLTFSDSRVPVVENNFRIQFEVDKFTGAGSNYARIIIFNLGQSARNTLAKLLPTIPYYDGPIVKLYAGYNDAPILLFSGAIVQAINNQEGPDWVTELSCFANITAKKTAFTNISYGTTTAVKKIVDDMIATFKIDVVFTSAALAAIEGKTVRSYAESTYTVKAINTFLLRYSLEYTSEDEGRGLIHKIGEARDKAAAHNSLNTFNAQNGMLGAPRISTSGVQLRSLLRPTVSLLQRIFVESSSLNSTLTNEKKLTGELYVSSIKHLGDSHKDEWYTEIEAYFANLPLLFRN